MDRDPLINLVRRADAAAIAPAERPHVADTVRRRFDRRRRVRRAAVACTAVCAVIAATAIATFTDNDSTVTRVVVSPDTVSPDSVEQIPALDVAAMRAELASLERECEAREAAVRRVLDGARPRMARTTDPLQELRWQREQAALVLVRQGDRLANDLALPDPAAVAYRSARDTFPDTHWGAVARARLADEY